MVQQKSKKPTTTRIKDFIEKFKFTRVGQIIGNGSAVAFQLDKEYEPSKSNVTFLAEKNGGLYLWVKAKRKTPQDILYIGMTRQTLNKRFGNHVQGAKGKLKENGRVGTGQKNADHLKDILRSGDKVLLYARGPITNMKAFGEPIKTCEAVEQVLIAIARNWGLTAELNKKPKVDQILNKAV